MAQTGSELLGKLCLHYLSLFHDDIWDVFDYQDLLRLPINNHCVNVDRYDLQWMVLVLLVLVLTTVFSLGGWFLGVELEAARELRMLSYQTFKARHCSILRLLKDCTFLLFLVERCQVTCFKHLFDGLRKWVIDGVKDLSHLLADVKDIRSLELNVFKRGKHRVLILVFHI